MKKIYTHELNEAKATKATFKCFMKRQRLAEGNIAETYPETRWKEGQERLAGPNGMSKTERSLLIKLEEQIPALVEKAMLKVQDHEDPQTIKKLILDMIVNKFVTKMVEKLGTAWIEFSMGFKKELKNMVINSIEQHNASKEEQEEIGVTGQPQEMEETPLRMEIQDLTHALTEYLSESWIAADTEEEYERLFYAVSDTLAKYKDYPESCDWSDCKEWCQKHYKEIESILFPHEEQEEIGATGQPQEMEEYPQRMEIQDLTHALTEDISESWIQTDTEEEYERLFYAVSETLAKYKDYPQSTDWEDCKEWCQKHYKEIEEKVKKQATLQGEAWSGYISSHYQEDEDYDPFEWEYDEYSKYSSKPDKSLRVKYKGRTFHVSITPAVEKEMKENYEDDMSDIQKDPRGASILAYFIQRMIDDAGYEPSNSERNFLKGYQSAKG